MLEAAYKAGYGKLLDLLQSEKWFALMKLQPKVDPVHAALQGCTFLFNYCKKKTSTTGTSQFKNPDDASILAQALANLGIQARIHAWQGRYYVLKLTGQKHSETGRKQPRMA
jgi:recombinational DNA repair protein RecR